VVITFMLSFNLIHLEEKEEPYTENPITPYATANNRDKMLSGSAAVPIKRPDVGASNGASRDHHMAPILQEIYARGNVLVNSRDAAFLKLLLPNGNLDPVLCSAIMTEHEYSQVRSGFARLRDHLNEIELESLDVVETDGRVEVRLPPTLNQKDESVASFIQTLENTIGTDRANALWTLIKLTPDFVGMTGNRSISFSDGRNGYWNLRVHIDHSVIETQGLSAGIPKDPTYHDGIGSENGIGGRYAHILDLQKMLGNVSNQH